MPTDLFHLASLARAATPAGGGDIAGLLDAITPETILALCRVVEAAEAWATITADLKSSPNDIGEACHQLRKALSALRGGK